MCCGLEISEGGGEQKNIDDVGQAAAEMMAHSIAIFGHRHGCQ
jgi:hypothetical protein